MPKTFQAQIDAHGNLILPPGLAGELGLTPGAQVQIEPNGQGLTLRPALRPIRRVYVEVTNGCNLNCSTCIRNVWNADSGQMSAATFEKILAGWADQPRKPELFLGGYGEPLSHPACLDLIERAKSLGHRVSLITNGILLTDAVSRRLIELKLDMLWVSLDGASPECYADVRLGDALPGVLRNLENLRTLKYQSYGTSVWAGLPKLGIAFVAMRRNIHDLTEVIQLGTRLGASEFSISNVLAHNAELREENLYLSAMNHAASQQSAPLVHLPLIDINEQTLKPVAELLKGQQRVEFFGSLLNQNTNQCPFIERDSLAVRWDGQVSPCIPLLYTHQYFLDQRERTSHEYFVGHLRDQNLPALWSDPRYVELRQKLQAFDFSPCSFCNSCEMANDNREDCFGNLQPTCGGCLWAQGLIRCP